MEPNPNLVMWGTIVGTAMPLLISVLNKPDWTPTTRAVVAFLACLVAAVGTTYFEGTLIAGDVASAFLAVFVTAIATYNLYWKPSGISPRIEQATSGV